jgi:arylsulfatase
VRKRFHQIIDIVPNILEAVGVEAPLSIHGVTQRPIAGASMMYTFDNANAPPSRRTQYLEMLANWVLYHDGWIA